MSLLCSESPSGSYLRVKVKVILMALGTYKVRPLPHLFDFIFHSVSPSSLQPHWSSCSSSKVASAHLSQGICTYSSHHLEHSFPRYPDGSLPHLLHSMVIECHLTEAISDDTLYYLYPPPCFICLHSSYCHPILCILLISLFGYCLLLLIERKLLKGKDFACFVHCYIPSS